MHCNLRLGALVGKDVVPDDLRGFRKGPPNSFRIVNCCAKRGIISGPPTLSKIKLRDSSSLVAQCLLTSPDSQSELWKSERLFSAYRSGHKFATRCTSRHSGNR